MRHADECKKSIENQYISRCGDEEGSEGKGGSISVMKKMGKKYASILRPPFVASNLCKVIDKFIALKEIPYLDFL